MPLPKQINAHQPIPAKTKTLDGLDQQRIYDQKIADNNLTTIINQLLKIPELDGVLLKDVALVSSGDNQIKHKLNRAFRGWYVVRKSAQTDLWESATNFDNTIFLTLSVSANVTVSIWVF